MLHDIGKLALDQVLPKSYRRVVELTELNQDDIARFERRICGIDHHTAGKRLAEHWRLPEALQACIWLHGSAYSTLPPMTHRRLIGLVSLADLLVRRHHLGYSGNFHLKPDPSQLAGEIGLAPSCVDSIGQKLHEQLHRRSTMLGLDQTPLHQMFVQSIQQANAALGRLNEVLARRSGQVSGQGQVLESIAWVHQANAPARHMQDALERVVGAAYRLLGGDLVAVLSPVAEAGPARSDPAPWLVCEVSGTQTTRCRLVQGQPDWPEPSQLHRGESTQQMTGWAQVLSKLLEVADDEPLHPVPLRCGWATAGILVHRGKHRLMGDLEVLATVWGAALAQATQHEVASRLGDQLAEANRTLSQMQDRLVEAESMARLGQMAAGAAHEMNNPLAVICGRSQLLARALPAGSNERQVAQTLHAQAHRLSDRLSDLHLFANPPAAVCRQTDVAALLNAVIAQVRLDSETSSQKMPILVQLKSQTTWALIDPDRVRVAVGELLLNAIQAVPATGVYVTVHFDQDDLVIRVTDDGQGMDSHVRLHAMDPFFSARPAGRRVGMGLTRAQQLAASHQGRLTLDSTPRRGTCATLTIRTGAQRRSPPQGVSAGVADRPESWLQSGR